MFEKEGNRSSEEKFLAKSSRNIECNKPQRTTYKGPQGSLIFTVEVTRSSL